MKTLILLLAALAAITEATFDDEALLRSWNTFKEEFGKTYENDIEEDFRKNTFMERMYRITDHNLKYELGLVSFKLGINKYSDMPHDEFIRTMTGLKPRLSKDHKKSVGTEFFWPFPSKLPSTVDWREKGYVTEVKEQRRCGACWAFSAVGALEGQYFKKTGKLVSLSEQNLIDCSSSYGNNGCKGGNMPRSFKYVMDKGIEAESTYPYMARKNLVCYFKPQKVVTTARGFINLPEGNEERQKKAVAEIGPISASFDGTLESFQDYTSGIYYDAKCSSDPDMLNHAFVIVGYGTDNGKDYWLAKNGWGTSWGDKGYVKVARNKDNHCGIATQSSYPMI